MQGTRPQEQHGGIILYSPQHLWAGNDPPKSQAENILQMTQQIMQQRKRTPTHRLESHEEGS